MKGTDWQNFDMYALVALALDLEGPQDLKKVLLMYTFLVRALYLPDECFEVLSSRCNLQNIVLSFLKTYSKVFSEKTFTFNLHQFLHLMSYRERNGPVFLYSTAPFEGMYAKARAGYKGNTPNVPLQLIQSFHLY